MIFSKIIEKATFKSIAAYNRLTARKGKSISISETYPIQGHRGARGLLPENTIPAFLKWLELGVPIFEFDVVISADKQVVVSHEEWMHHYFCSKPDGTAIDRKEEKQHLLYQMSYEQIKTYDCGRRGHPLFPAQQPMAAYKPLLSEVIEACDAYAQTHDLPPTTYNIEVKTSGEEADGHLHPAPTEFVALVNEVIQRMGIENRVIVQSFDRRIVQAAKAIGQFCPLSLLVDNLRGVDWNVRKLGFTPDIYDPYYALITPITVKKAHDKGMKIWTWTVNDLYEMRQLIDMGVDGIITDYPNLKRVVLARGDVR